MQLFLESTLILCNGGNIYSVLPHNLILVFDNGRKHQNQVTAVTQDLVSGILRLREGDSIVDDGHWLRGNGSHLIGEGREGTVPIEWMRRPKRCDEVVVVRRHRGDNGGEPRELRKLNGSLTNSGRASKNKDGLAGALASAV